MKKLLILSGKGGTGKTSTAASFIAFSKTKAIADCDVDAPNLHLILNFNNPEETKNFIGSQKAVINASKCINCGKCKEYCRFNAIQRGEKSYISNIISCEGCGVCEYICPVHAIELKDDISGQQFIYQKKNAIFSTAQLKMGRGNSGKLVTNVKKTLYNKISDSENKYTEHTCNENSSTNTELAIIDGSPGIGCPVIASINGVDLILVVAEPSASGLSDLQRLVQTAQTLQTALCVYTNKWDLNPEYTQKIQTYCHENNIPYLGCVPYDNTVSKAINQNKNIADFNSSAVQELREIYEKTLKLLENKHEIVRLN